MNRRDDSDQESILDAQQELLETSLPLVFAAYDAASQAGMSQPVVLLLDCEDEVGSQIAQSWLGRDTVEEAVEYRQLMDAAEVGANEEEVGSQTTIFAHAFSLEECRAEVPVVFPYLATVFDEELAPHTFLAVAVTCGGACALTVPLSARES